MTKGSGSGSTHPNLVKFIQAAIAKKGQRTVELETGLSHSMLSRYKRGVGEPTSATLEKLANYFGVHVTLLRDDGGFFEWGTLDTFENKFFLVAENHFSLALENDYLEIDDLNYVQLLVELAKMITEIPMELLPQDKASCLEYANKIIRKYEKRTIERHKYYRDLDIDVGVSESDMPSSKQPTRTTKVVTDL